MVEKNRKIVDALNFLALGSMLKKNQKLNTLMIKAS